MKSGDKKGVALIPARSGSKRIPHKNIRKLGEHPLIAYSITTANKCGLFEDVIVATDDPLYAEISKYYGALVPDLRPLAISDDMSPDIEWVDWILRLLEEKNKRYDYFSILRPTNPFRQIETIRRAFDVFINAEGADSLRAVEKCQQHPAKMWVVRNNRMLPLLPLTPENRPWHSCQYASLPVVYVQNASIEIAWSRVVFETKTIAGVTIVPFYTEGFEGLDLNTEFDWWKAEYLIKKGEAKLPEIDITPWKD